VCYYDAFDDSDIKPDNWMFGRKETKRNKTLCIIDFGLGKLYIDEKTGRHIKQEKAPFALGTARYMPVRAHEFIAQSRRDDLEAIGFVCIYFLNGELPWQSVDEEDKLKRNKKIQEWKKIRVEKLCEKHPAEFADYFRRVRSLTFTQRPDYKGYRKLFTSLAARKNIKLDFMYDWEKSPN
jgi:serine/threonine protein kinase